MIVFEFCEEDKISPPKEPEELLALEEPMRSRHSLGLSAGGVLPPVPATAYKGKLGNETGRVADFCRV